MNWSIVAGAAAGAGAMFLLDPGRGARRRALVRDKMVRAARATSESLETTARDVAQRAHGVAAEVRGRISDSYIDDGRLAARVRAELGRVTSHPRSLHVEARNGRVRLSGPILEAEVEEVMGAVRAVRGVSFVEDALDRHAVADIPALQVGRVRPGRRSALVGGSWSPTTRMLVGVGVGTAVAVSTVAAASARRGSAATSGRGSVVA